MQQQKCKVQLQLAELVNASGEANTDMLNSQHPGKGQAASSKTFVSLHQHVSDAECNVQQAQQRAPGGDRGALPNAEDPSRAASGDSPTEPRAKKVRFSLLEPPLPESDDQPCPKRKAGMAHTELSQGSEPGGFEMGIIAARCPAGLIAARRPDLLRPR